MKTAVIGPAQNSATANVTVKMISAPGVYDINAINGSIARFDHTGNLLIGNKGSIANSSVSLLGIGV